MNLNVFPLASVQGAFRSFRIWSLLVLAQVSAFAEPTPTRVPSFGPNGTKWPGQISGLVTPFMYDETVPNRIEVEPNFTAIAAAINGLTAAQVNAGVLILVRPGTLVGGGGSSQSPLSLNAVGDKTWTKRVTVCPRDGFGTVTISNGLRIDRMRNICFAGFVIDGKLRIQSSTRFAFAWCVVNGNIAVSGTVAGEPDPRQWEFVEFVKREVYQPDATDPMQLQSFDNLGKTLDGLVQDGCYYAPNYMNIGSTAHQDTIQHFSFDNNAFFSSFTYQDTVIFASNRCAVNGGLRNGVFRNCWINARKNNQTPRYPIGAGAEMASAGLSQGTKANITFDGGVYMGSLQSNTGASPNPYPTVMNGAKIDYQPSGQAAPLNGKWIVDTTLNGHTNPGYPPLPTDSFLNSIWKKGATPPTGKSASPPVFFPPGDVYDSQQSVTISSATSGAVIRYTTNGSEPTNSSPVYSSPISVSSPTTLKAIAISEGLDDSSVSSATYDIRVVTPVIVPSGGEFLSPQVANITTSTVGATIHYTLDGSTPTAASSVYTTGVPIPSSATLKAIAIKQGLPASSVRQANFMIGGASFELGEDWANLAISPQTSTFEINYSCIPAASGIDAVTGVGGDLVETFTELACIVRFAPSGVVDVRDGSGYRASSTLTYKANTLYRVGMNINVATKRYSVTVTPEGGTPVVLATNYAFRTEQNTLSELKTFAFVRVGTGSLRIQNIAIGPQLLVGPSAPKGLRILR
jgi:hypothetical protein